MHSRTIRRINQETGVSTERIEATVRLLEDGATVPFIARYRKDVTGNLDESRIWRIADHHSEYLKLERRRQEILALIERAGAVPEEFRERIRDCDDRLQLEDFYLPYRSAGSGKSIPQKQELGELAGYILQGSPTSAVEEHALRFVNEENNVPTTAAAIEGAIDILAERLAKDPESREWLRNKMLSDGVVQTTVAEGKTDESTKYSMYHDFSEPVSRIPSHRMLAIRRAARKKLLTFSVRIDEAQALTEFKARITSKPESMDTPDTETSELLQIAAERAYRRWLEPSIQKQVRSLLRSRAEDEAIEVCQDNLRALLMAPPAGRIPLIGVAPGSEKGAQVAAVNPHGDLLEHQTIHVAEPKRDLVTAERVLIGLINAHAVRGIVVGEGRGSRETEAFIRSLVARYELEVFVALAAESAAALLAGKHTRREFPRLEGGYRRAISAARRLQDPLSELVKVDPRSIGVGQYQHDVDQRKLTARLAATVAEAVNRIGTDVNTASVDRLRRVAGLSEKHARSIVAHRTEHGAFRARSQLREVDGLEDKEFEQAAGFLRIEAGTNPLDRTSIHPESYSLVEQMAKSLDLTVPGLIGNRARLDALDLASFEKDAGQMTLADIRAELRSPGRDPRRPFVPLKTREGVSDLRDLKEGMELEGIVTNVTNFGAFVDLGIRQDGLIHISELSHQYVADARRAVQIGSVVQVKVIGIDLAGKRISLSRKALMPKATPPPKQRPKPKGKERAEAKSDRQRTRTRRPRTRESAVSLKRGAPPKPQTMEEKIRRLQEKFKAPDR